MGAVVAAAAAARQRRIQQTIDSFRLGDATAPERARRLEDLGVLDSGETRDLIVEGVLLPGPQDGTFYLSEASYIYQRDGRRRNLKVVLIVLLVLAIIGAILLPLAVVRS
jgi:hypothetical protein